MGLACYCDVLGKPREVRAVGLMQSYSRAESTKAGRGHGTWGGGAVPSCWFSFKDFESCLNVGHPRSGNRSLLMEMRNGWFRTCQSRANRKCSNLSSIAALLISLPH